MDATQQIDDPFSEEEEEQEEEEKGGPEREQLATLKVFQNDHIPETGECSYRLSYILTNMICALLKL